MAIVHQTVLDENRNNEVFFHEDTGIVTLINNYTEDTIMLTPSEVKTLVNFLIYRMDNSYNVSVGGVTQ